MNDRIKELSDQAHEFALKTINFGENFGDIWIEKLGKLIIQDCIKELEISKKGDPYTGDVYDCEYNKCIDDQITVLKEHFGVEETRSQKMREFGFTRRPRGWTKEKE